MPNQMAVSASPNHKENGFNTLMMSSSKLDISLQKIKQDHLYLHVFVGGSPVCLFGVGGYIFKCLETLFLDKSFRKCSLHS